VGCLDLAVRRVVDDAFDVRLGEVRNELAGSDDGTVAELAQPAERFVAEEHGEQRPRAQSIGGCGGGPHRHLDEGVEATLLKGANRSVAFVLQPQRVADAVQLFLEDLPADRVEHRLEVAFAAPPGSDRAVATLTRTFGLSPSLPVSASTRCFQ
jgi:hypothetical protein